MQTQGSLVSCPYPSACPVHKSNFLTRIPWGQDMSPSVKQLQALRANNQIWHPDCRVHILWGSTWATPSISKHYSTNSVCIHSFLAYLQCTHYPPSLQLDEWVASGWPKRGCKQITKKIPGVHVHPRVPPLCLEQGTVLTWQILGSISNTCTSATLVVHRVPEGIATRLSRSLGWLAFQRRPN